ncbi:MAG: PDZ domain-containing protein [Pirellulales bacterium]
MRCSHLGTGFWFLATVMACSLVGAQEPAQEPAAPPDEVRPADPDEEADEETLFGLVLDQTEAPRILVSSVAPGSLAAEAGFEKGDEITRFDDQPIASAVVLQERLLAIEPGESVTLHVFRGDDQTVRVVLKVPAQRQPPPQAKVDPAAAAADVGFSGMFLRQVSPRRVVVIRVSPNTPAEAAGIRAGDEVVAVDRKRAVPLDGLMNFATKLFGTLEPGQAVPVTIRRDGEEQVVELAVAENPAPRPPQQASDQLIPPDVLTTIGLAVLERPSNTLRVAAVVAHSPAAVAGIQRGDIIRSLAQQPIGTAEELAAVISMHQRGEAVPFEVVRRRETVTGSLTLRAEPAAMVDYVRALQEQVDALSRTVEAMSKEIEALRGESGGRSAAGARPGRREPIR